jgi:pyruvate dehydrogenase E1 component alpha subunit
MMNSEQLWKMYREMLMMRRFEERVLQLYQEKYIRGFCHVYIGQEAVLCGTRAVMRPQDTCMTAYRCHAHMLAFGVTPRAIMAELTGKESGCSHGKGGSMHMYAPQNGFYGGHGIVGAYVSIGTGIGFAHKYRKTDAISFSFFGEGASNQGQVFESYNMAALWKLPVVYIIENNGYCIGTSQERGCAGGDLYKRGEPFGIPGMLADGMDVFDVMKKVKWAVDHVKSGAGPAIVEAKTYRYKGHSVSDPANYRSKEEVDSMKQRDPLMFIEAKLKEINAFSEEEQKRINKEIMDEVRDAAEFAKSELYPDPKELYTNIYAGSYK